MTVSPRSSAVEVSLELPATVEPGDTVTVTADVENLDVAGSNAGAIELTSVPAPLSVTSTNPVFLAFGGNPAPATGETVSQSFEIAVAEDAAVDQKVTLTAEASLASSSTEATTTTTGTVTISDEGPVQRFDTNEQPGIQRDEVIDAIVSFNNDSTVGGGEVSRGNIVTLIVQFNS